MKNFIITVKTYGDKKYDVVTNMKVLSNVVAFCGDLYSLDYQGYEHGIDMGYDGEGMFYIEVIINNFDLSYNIMETAEDLSNNFSRYGTFDVFVKITEVPTPTEIPEHYIEHYYVNSYHDFY